MDFRTPIETERPPFQIEPGERMLFVGSCFADSIGRRMAEEQFEVTANPYGTMYNPVSVLHTVERHLAECNEPPRVVFITLGTNHVYRLKETGKIVDNCQKRPARLFSEEQLNIDECAATLLQAIGLLRSRRSDVHVVLTVSPIRYRKYGMHGSQLSKATLLLAVEKVIKDRSLTPSPHSSVSYFPAYEIVLDELRDYRFYADDMLHPSPMAVEYIWQQIATHYLSGRARCFVEEWKPLKEALAHRPLHPDSEEYRDFARRTAEKVAALKQKYGLEQPE
jgi:hypothetical protein